MIQHPVVEGFEPDADILSIHIARIPNSARHARILFQRPVETRGLQTTSVRLRNRACETRKTNMALTSPWGPSINRVLGRTPRRYVRSSRGPRLNRGLQPVQQRRGGYSEESAASTQTAPQICVSPTDLSGFAVRPAETRVRASPGRPQASARCTDRSCTTAASGRQGD